MDVGDQRGYTPEVEVEDQKTAKSTLADGKTDTYGITEGVEIRWKDLDTVLPTLLVPDAKDVMLGALPLEAMDMLVDPVRKRLAGTHADQPVHPYVIWCGK